MLQSSSLGPDVDRQVALRSKHLAFENYHKDNFGLSFAHSLFALKLVSEWKQELRDFFRFCLCEWAKKLEQERRYNDLFKCYEEALEVYPGDAVILNNLGAHLHRLNFLTEAAQHFRASLAADAFLLPALKNLQNVSNKLVERWHYRMINDTYRNDSFRRAIHEVLKQGYDTVLDIGCGTGILSLFAASNASVKKIYACDYSETMFNICKGIINNNGYNDKITVINKLSNDLKIPEDIPERLSLLVTETVDCALLGEHVLDTVIDALERLLLPVEDSKPRVIPNSATLYATIIECKKIATKNKSIDRSGFRKWPFHLSRFSEEPYDAQDLTSTEHRVLAQPLPLVTIDFNDLDGIRRLLKDNRRKLFFSPHVDGHLDAFVVWFDMSLSESVTITNSPFNPKNASWDQAIFPVTENIYVTKENNVCVTFGFLKDKLFLDSYKVEPWVELPKSSSVCRDVVKYVNDIEMVKNLEGAFDDLKSSYILDLSPFPAAGFKISSSGGTAVCLTSCPLSCGFIKSTATDLGLDCATFSVHHCDSVSDFLRDKSLKFDLIILDLFNTKGEIKEESVSLIPALRNNLSRKGVIFPAVVSVHFQLINWSLLKSISCFSNPTLEQNYSGFECLNDYKMNQIIDVDYSCADFTAMSGEIKMAELTLDNLMRNECIKFTKATEMISVGSFNALLFWFSVERNGRQIFNSLRSNSWMHQAIEILPETIVQLGDIVQIQLLVYNSILKFNLLSE